MSALGSPASFNVGGVMLPRPFKVRRFGHFGLNVESIKATIPFYRDLLGFSVSDTMELAGRFPSPEEVSRYEETAGYFLRHGAEHHSAVFFPKKTLNALNGSPPLRPSFSLNQMAWQVGSLDEVVQGIDWFEETGTRLLRVGRDQPGGNWHVYGFDPDGHVNELFYGIEIVGWDGRSRSMATYSRLLERPVTPVPPLYQELADAAAQGHDLLAGHQTEPPGAPRYPVDGVLLPRPFKIVRSGPMRIFASNVARSCDFYRDVLGLSLTEETEWRQHRCAFLRAGTEHHSLAIYPLALREELALSAHTTCFSVGLQVASYAQLRDALSFLVGQGVVIRRLPSELFPGIDYSAFAIDPDGQAVQLYYAMEQIGWDGKPRPAELRPRIDNDNWPEALSAAGDAYSGEAYLGPWG